MSSDNFQSLDGQTSRLSSSIDNNISSTRESEPPLSPSRYPLPASPIVSDNPSIEDAILKNDVVLLHDALIKKPSLDLNTLILRDGRTPFMSAAHSGSVDVLNFLLYHMTVDVNLLDKNGQTALHQAAESGNVEVLNLLIAAHAKVNVEDKDNVTPLMIAAQNGNLDACRNLLDKGRANINCKNNLKKTPLALATYEGHTKVVELLLSRDANVNCTDLYGWTPLMVAADTGNSEICQLLLKYHADITIATSSGKTASLLAHESGHENIVELIQNHTTTRKKRKTSINILDSRISSEQRREPLMISIAGNEQDPYTSQGFMMPIDDLRNRRISITPKSPDKRRSRYFSIDADRYSTAPHIRRDMHPRQKYTPWVIFSKIITACIPKSRLVKIGKMLDSNVQQAWREKVALCFVIIFVTCFMGFIAFAFTTITCSGELNIYPEVLSKNFGPDARENAVIVHGKIYNIGDYIRLGYHRPILPYTDQNLSAIITSRYGQDISDFFPLDQNAIGCPHTPTYPNGALCAAAQENDPRLHCHTSHSSIRALEGRWTGNFAAYSWDTIENTSNRKLFAYQGRVYDVTSVLDTRNPWFNDSQITAWLSTLVGTDATAALARQTNFTQIEKCFPNFLVGKVDGRSPTCSLSTLMIVLLTGIFTMVTFIKFFSSLAFDWFIVKKSSKYTEKPKDQTKYIAILVPCYSEGEEPVRAALDSLAASDYSNEHKLFFVVADGDITGAGNDKSTPEILKGLMETTVPQDGTEPEPQSYLALGDGSKRHNMARVYAGFYRYQNERVPMILVNKCGTPEERNGPKAGNRGKRDTQLILMQLLTHSFFNEKMSALEFDIFEKIRLVAGVTADHYEFVVMMDSDTLSEKGALKHMVGTMENDSKIMGICGETIPLNMNTNWVTRIQVFEYFISHQLGKAFESVFASVSCLPGCFCMYRVFAEKYDGYRVPILANPDVLETYSTNDVRTLHQKNLLLLGEDRFLTTLMLRTFPARKTHYCSKALCYTIVPDTFSVLVSQRRRWINGTVHNLYLLMKVPQLPGIFCWSMQFVVFLDLFATITTPFAYIFLLYLIISACFSQTITLPLFYFSASLFSQGLLALLKTHNLVYLVWFFIFIGSYPIWNLILPLYAFWHFDDFSWGATRKIDGVDKGHGENDEHYFDPRTVKMKKWDEWVKYLRKRNKLSYDINISERTIKTKSKSENIAEALKKLSNLSAL